MITPMDIETLKRTAEALVTAANRGRADEDDDAAQWMYLSRCLHYLAQRLEAEINEAMGQERP